MASFPPLRLRAALSMGGLTLGEVARRTWKGITDNEIQTRAAGVAFYAMLALVPFLALVITATVSLLPDVTGLTGRTTGIANLTTESLRSTLRQLFPNDAYHVVEDQISRLQKEARPSLLLWITGLAATLWVASSLFVAVIDALNRIYGVDETRSLVKIRLTAIVMTVIQAVILVGSLLIIVLWPQIVTWLGLGVPAALLATLVQWIIVSVMVLLSFALTFYVGPDADQRWEWITPGSLAGTVGVLVASLGFRIYVQNFTDYNKVYGSLGGVMILLFWFWITSLILLAAAQANKVIEEASPLGKKYGQKVDPTEPPDLASLKPEPATEGESAHS
ncbi:MAG: YihY/virulence factor BrkB family protein [Isosphaeraceae bacterium]